MMRKRAVKVMGMLVYTLLVSQLTTMMIDPVIATEYIEVEVPVYKEVLTKEIIVEEIEDYETVTAIVTAYAPFDNKSGICNDGNPNKTATGTKPKHGTLAANPKRLPYGTKVEIPNYGVGIVEDTGGMLRADKENIRIDVFVDTYEEAMKFGKQELEVKVYN